VDLPRYLIARLASERQAVGQEHLQQYAEGPHWPQQREEKQ
jgi:hypothetical protein